LFFSSSSFISKTFFSSGNCRSILAEKFTPMSFSAFLLIVLGIYAAYYGILFLIDRFSGSVHGRVRQADTLYAFDASVSPQQSMHATESAKDQLHPLTYLPSSDSSQEHDEDNDLDLVYLPDDTIEPVQDLSGERAYGQSGSSSNTPAA
jgi:hypothetical protein